MLTGVGDPGNADIADRLDLERVHALAVELPFAVATARRGGATAADVVDAGPL